MPEQTVAERLTYISANIRRLREKLGWTQQQLADEVSVELRYVQTLESGRANPTASTLVRVADALDVAPGALFRPAKLVKRSAGRPSAKRRG